MSELRTQTTEVMGCQKVLLQSRHLRARLLRHFAFSVLLPMAGVFAAAMLLARGEASWWHLAILLLMYFLVGCVGVSVGFHRHFTHRSFTTTRLLKVAFGVLGSMAGQGPLAYWVAVHRYHHKCSDSPGDPHSPFTDDPFWPRKLAAFFHGHIGWALNHDVPNPTRYAADIVRDPHLVWLTRTYRRWVLLGFALPAVLGYTIDGTMQGAFAGFVWGGLLRMCLVNQITWAVNSIGHTFGRHDFDTSDNSRNNMPLALISWGEGWHNNHHHSPTSARLSATSWQIDLGWLVVRALSAMRLVDHVRVSSADSKISRGKV